MKISLNDFWGYVTIFVGVIMLNLALGWLVSFGLWMMLAGAITVLKPRIRPSEDEPEDDTKARWRR